jgi:predicted esterase
MKSLGFTSVKFTTYPGGHEVSSDEAADVVTWWLSLAASGRD